MDIIATTCAHCGAELSPENRITTAGAYAFCGAPAKCCARWNAAKHAADYSKPLTAHADMLATLQIIAKNCELAKNCSDPQGLLQWIGERAADSIAYAKRKA